MTTEVYVTNHKRESLVVVENGKELTLLQKLTLVNYYLNHVEPGDRNVVALVETIGEIHDKSTCTTITTHARVLLNNRKVFPNDKTPDLKKYKHRVMDQGVAIIFDNTKGEYASYPLISVRRIG